MIRITFKLWVRKFLRSLGYSLVNTISLAVGISAFLLISFFLWHELSYEHHLTRSKSLYRVNFVNGDGAEFANTPSALSVHLRNDLPGIAEVVRLYTPFTPENQALIEIDDRIFYDHALAYVDTSFLKVFEIQWLQGSSRSLDDPNSLVISESAAERWFGHSDPVGKNIRIDAANEFKVSGVFKDFPSNTHLQFNALLPFHRNRNLIYQWQYWDVTTYIQLTPGVEVSQLQAKVKGLLKQHAGAYWLDFWNNFSFHIQPLQEIHLAPNVNYGLGTPTALSKLIFVWIIAALVLLLSLSNYLSLAMAGTVDRIKELAIIKSLGTSRKMLILQAFFENTITTVIASLLSVFIIALIWPTFRSITQVAFDFGLPEIYFFSATLMGIMLLIIMVVSLYPIGVVSRMQPGSVLRSQSSVTAHKRGLRSVLVVFQIMTLSFLLAFSWIMNNQFSFITGTNPGFDKENVVLIRMRQFTATQQVTIKELIRQIPGVNGVARTSTPLGSEPGMWGFSTPGMPANDPRGIMYNSYVDRNFFEVAKMQLKEGRLFEREEMPAGFREFVVNEAFVRSLDLKDPLDSRLQTNEMQGTIIGVVQDFNFLSVEQPIMPFVFSTQPLGAEDTREAPYQFLMVRINAGMEKDVIDEAQKIWKENYSELPFEYFFQDRFFDKLFDKQMRMKQIFTICATIAAITGFFGLFAFTSYQCRHARREIAIRKIMGASSGLIFTLVTFRSLRLVMIALTISLPAAAYFLEKWLQEQTLRIDLDIVTFVTLGTSIVIFSVLVILVEVVVAARLNPVKVIRDN
ncbi:MAG: ABC transporter permease [Bacteroidetes bacterium]|nr:ABC transporter permease [Bacteroidota bacterium]